MLKSKNLNHSEKKKQTKGTHKKHTLFFKKKKKVVVLVCRTFLGKVFSTTQKRYKRESFGFVFTTTHFFARAKEEEV